MPRRKKMKKVWTHPLLTVVVRGKPEERLLDACKQLAMVGPINGNVQCEALLMCGGECNANATS